MLASLSDHTVSDSEYHKRLPAVHCVVPPCKKRQRARPTGAAGIVSSVNSFCAGHIVLVHHEKSAVGDLMSIHSDGGLTMTWKAMTKGHSGNAAKQLQLHTDLRLQDQSIDCGRMCAR